MSEENFLNRQRRRWSAEKTLPVEQYTAKDFQFEVLGKLADMESMARSLEENWRRDLKAVQEQRVVRFDSRALVAMGALALSIAGFVIEDARNSARQDSEIEATKSRVVRLEQIAATNTEGRIRTETQLQALREGQAEIKALIQAHDSASKKAVLTK